MRVTLAVILLAAAASTCLAQESKERTSKDANTKKLLESKARAILEVGNFRDTERLNNSLESVMHDDCLIVDPNGKTFSKQEEIALVRNHSRQFTGVGKEKEAEDSFSLKVQDVNVRMFGHDTAVVTGRSVVRGKFQGRDISGNYRFTQVYKLGGGAGGPNADAKAAATQWQMITCLSTEAQ